MDNQKLYLEDYRSGIYATYAKKRPKSEWLHKEARRFLPGGETRNSLFYKPFPAFMMRGEGCRLYDVDGNEYVDFLNNYTSLIHGHAHPEVEIAAIKQFKRGTIYAAPVEDQFRLGQTICDRLPSAEKVVFCNSGTDATLSAIRLARAFRRKYKIVKMEGGYHGSHDVAQISVKPPLDRAGPIANPHSIPENIGIPASVLSDCIIAPFNNGEATERIISQNSEDLAAVIVEPVQGAAGVIPPDPDFLRTIRQVTSEYNIPLIFDEVISFRLARGGCQEMYGITPDITALGKIIGGGFPIGAVAGREELMDLFSPYSPGFLSHSGTFYGHPVTMAAGVAAMEQWTTSEITRLNKLGEKLINNIKNALEEVGIDAQVTGVGSLAQIHFTKEEIRDWRAAATARFDIRTLFHLLLMDKGIFLPTRLMFSLSTPMDEKEIGQTTTGVKDCLEELKPCIERVAPELIIG
jgi:glutamate-1-semialdehyde 2,1-aminomutase